MQIVATKPLFLSKELVSASALENEREILRTQAESSGKSQMAMDKMVEGRLRKYYEEVGLMEQKYVLNDNTNVKTVLNDLSKEVGSKVTIGNFIRMEIGQKLMSLGPQQSGRYMTIRNVYLEDGNWHAGARMGEVMQEAGIMKAVGQSSVVPGTAIP
jgi:hypothetical protein